LREPDLDGLADVWEPVSPDGQHVLTESGPQLAVRHLRSGQVRQLTSDGDDLRPWRANAQLRSVLPTPPVWSPAGTHVLALQADLSELPEQPLPDWRSVPPRVLSRRLPAEGAPGVERGRLAVIDLAGTSCVWLEVPDHHLHLPLRWLGDGATVLLLSLDASAGTLSLVRADTATGRAVTLMRDSVVSVFAYLPAVLSAALCRLPEEETALWASDRDGDLRLYQVSDDSAEPITPPGVQVERVLGVLPGGTVLLTAHAVPGRPYDVQVCRADAGDFRVLTPEPGLHQVAEIQVDGSWLDRHTSLDRPAQVHVRSLRDSTVLESRDQPDDLARGHQEAFTTTAADGRTELHGVLFLPVGSGPHPVVDVVYGGPHVIAHPRSRGEGGSHLWDSFGLIAESLAVLGFAAVVLDARGTPGRGRAFQQYAAQRPGELLVEDHATSLRQLADRHPALDLSRCGVLGTSFGAYYALRCGLLRPDLFRAVVAHAGPYDLAQVMPGWFAPMLGTSYRDDPGAYRAAGLVARAAEFRPELLLVHGTHDVNVPVCHTMRLSHELNEAGKKHQLLLLQGQSHHLRGASAELALKAAAGFLAGHLSSQPATGGKP
jgi:dipeptidyl aminopeptidase/acylaminoacyl peptidase